jgi:uncharacterized oxidoreductase
MDLNNNTILITDGATGIGFALVKQLSDHGNRVIICGPRESALARAKEAVPALETRACDIASEDSRRELIDWIDALYPDLNMLINNAGVQHHRLFAESGVLDNLNQQVVTNFTAQIHMIGDLLPLLRRQPQATIVNVSYGPVSPPTADTPVYDATKAAIHAFTLALRHQLKTTGIRVVEMAPPIVDTELGGKRDTSGASQWVISPEDFAIEALRQLAEDKDDYRVA